MINLEQKFPKFGINKKREIERLICEISKIENIPPETILLSIQENDYEKVKNILIKKRYPQNFTAPLSSFYLPKYEINSAFKTDTKPSNFYPKNIYYTSKAAKSKVFDNAKKLFPNARFNEIDSLKSFQKDKKFTITDFNRRCENLFLVEEKYDFFKRCPCTSGVVNCGYSIMNLGLGCPYECSYCFLQGYQNISGIVLPYNIDDYLTDEKTAVLPKVKGLFNYSRIGSGEFTDSLVFDHITGFSKEIVSFFRQKEDTYFEFKTKSVNIQNLLEIGGSKNIVAAWSLNSLKIQTENEFKSPDIMQRLNAAKECALAGFSIAFHFDPIVFYENWQEGYKEVIDMIFDIVPNDCIKWISLGTLRMPAILKPIIENRFPDSSLLNGEFLLGKDYKLRYSDKTRVDIYRYMRGLIKSKKSKTIVYLCMEDGDIWKNICE